MDDFNPTSPNNGLGYLAYLSLMIPFIPIHYIARCVILGLLSVVCIWFAVGTYRRDDDRSAAILAIILQVLLGGGGIWAVIIFKDELCI